MSNDFEREYNDFHQFLDDFERQYNDFPQFSEKNTILNDSTTNFIDFLKNNQKPLCFSVVSHPAEPHVSIFIANMKMHKKHMQHRIYFLTFKSPERASTDIDCSKHDFWARQRIPRIFRIQRKRDTRRRAQPPEHSRQRSG